MSMSFKASQKVFALVDCNSFFCSCEKLFRPDLEGRPVGVLSNNDGCFVSRTPELKAIGVGMAQPYFQVKELCQKHKAVVFSSNFSLYTNISQRVMSVLAEMTPVLEVYSVDEAFLDLTGFKNIEEYALKIKEEVFRKIGIPVSVGVGPTKTLAKVANNWAKKHKDSNGVKVILDTKSQDKTLAETTIGDVWGVGRASVSKMQSLNIQTAKDFRDYKNEKLIQKIFTKVGKQRQEELKGLPRFELNVIPEARKGITCSRSFGTPVLRLEELKEAVAHYVSYACEKLRKQNSLTARVRVHVRTSKHSAIEHSYKASDFFELETATADTRKVIRYAFSALDKLYKAGYKYKKAGVDLSGITSRPSPQMQFFVKEVEDDEKSKKLMQAMDKINKKEGPGTLALGVCFATTKKWQMNSAKRSPRYVSGWSEICKVK